MEHPFSPGESRVLHFVAESSPRPFSILPLEDYVANVETAASQMLAQESQCDVQGGELVIGADAVPMTEFMTVYVSEPPS